MEHMTTHRLRPSDSLEALSVKYHVPVCMIMRANALTSSQQMFRMRAIKMPYRCYCNRRGENFAEEYGKYVVQPDDTLYGIARKFGLTMRILLKANNMEDPGDLMLGEALVIPRLTGTVYASREGESLVEIARRFGTTARHLRQVNRLEQREGIYPGLLLLIPEN